MIMKVDRKKFARRLKSLRKKYGLTGEKLALKAGLSTRHIVKIETCALSEGGGFIGTDVLLSLAKALDIDVTELLGDTVTYTEEYYVEDIS